MRNEKIESLNDICGVYHAKRAVEVALAGGFTIEFVGTPESEARALSSYVNHHEELATATFEQMCPCGYFGHPSKECTCGVDVIARYQAHNLGNSDLQIPVPDCAPDEIMAWVGGKRGEPDEEMFGRIDNTTDYTTVKIDEACQPLLKAAVVQMDLGYRRVVTVIKVARTIANLAHSEKIHLAHLAEAIQYLPRPNLL